MGIKCRKFTPEEITGMLSNFKTERDKCLFIVGIRTGFRIGELRSIKIKDVFDNGIIKSSVKVPKQYMKGKVASREVPLHNEARIAIAKYLELRLNSLSAIPKEVLEQPLFLGRGYKPLSRKQALRNIRSALLASVVNIDGNIGTHSCRKTFASRMYEIFKKDLVPTKEALGHHSVESTIRYLDVNAEKINEAILQ